MDFNMVGAVLGFVILLFGVSAKSGSWDPLGQPYFDNSTKRETTAAVGQPAFLHCKVRNLADRSIDIEEPGALVKPYRYPDRDHCVTEAAIKHVKQVSWIRKRDLHILTVGVHTYSSDGRFASLHADGSDEWTLRVSPAQPRDSGAYECQVSTEPKISLLFRLTVVVSKAEILNGPELFVRAGSDINLTCVTKHAPDPPSFIYWYRGDQVVNYAQRGGISVLTEQRTRTSRLLIARALPHDSGNYTCAPSSSESASVMVHVLSGEHPAAMQSNAPAARLNALLVTSLITICAVQAPRSSLTSIVLTTYFTFILLVIFIFVINCLINCILYNSFALILNQR